MNSVPTQPGDRDLRSVAPPAPTVLVLGGSGVIGSAICQQFARRGWNVGVHYHTNHASTNATLHMVEQCGRRGALFQADIGDPKQIHALFDQVQTAWQGLDACVWAVGRTVNRVAIRITPQEWEQMVHIHLTGLFLCFQRAMRLFPEQRGGSVTVIGSLSSTLGRAGQTAYAACKAGALGFVKSAARECGGANVRVNVVFPGWHSSPLAGDAFPTQDNLGDHVLGRTPTLDEVADFVYLLATSRNVSGQICNVDNRLW